MDELSLNDCARLAALHLEALPDSLVSELGRRFAESFYRHLRHSSDDRLFVVRDERGNVIGGCVLSLRPKTLRRRLLLHTPLLFYAAPWLVRQWRTKRRQAAPGSAALPNPLPDHMPELILIFTASASRNRGAGAALLDQCEAFLAAQCIPEYAARTVDEPDNRALKFYLKNGFEACGQSTDHGRVFKVFKKTVQKKRLTT